MIFMYINVREALNYISMSAIKTQRSREPQSIFYGLDQCLTHSTHSNIYEMNGMRMRRGRHRTTWQCKITSTEKSSSKVKKKNQR